MCASILRLFFFFFFLLVINNKNENFISQNENTYTILYYTTLLFDVMKIIFINYILEAKQLISV